MDQWRRAKGVENPADICTRGMIIEGIKYSEVVKCAGLVPEG